MTPPQLARQAVLRLSCLGGVIGAGLFASPALADTRFGLQLDGGASAGSNPFLQGSGADAGVAATVAVQPRLTIESARSSLQLGGSVREEAYVEHYGSNLYGSVGATATHRLNARTTVRANADFMSSRTTLRDSIAQRADPGQPDTTAGGGLAGPLPDTSLLGTRERTDNLNAALGIDWKPGARDGFTASGRFGESRTEGRPLNNYRYFGGALAYQRRLSQRTSLSVSMNASGVSYLNTSAGDGRTLSPSAGVNIQFNKALTLALDGGVTFTHTEQGNGETTDGVALAASVKLCRRQDRDNLCFSASRAVQPTSLGGISTVTAVGLDYSVRLSARNALSLSANYNRTDQSNLNGASDLPQYIGAEAQLSRQFARRLRGFVTAGVDKATGTVLTRPTNYNGSIGIGYTFGSLQ